MSITLAVPPAVVAEIRSWAEENGTSLNQYIRGQKGQSLLIQ